MCFAGDVSEAVRHARTINREIRTAQAMDSTELYEYAKKLQVPIELLRRTAEMGRLPVVNFAAGGIGKFSAFIHFYTMLFVVIKSSNYRSYLSNIQLNMSL